MTGNQCLSKTFLPHITIPISTLFFPSSLHPPNPHHTTLSKMLSRASCKAPALAMFRLSQIFSCNYSTAAMTYKLLHRNTKRPPLPTINTPNWSTNAAISSILTETPMVHDPKTQSQVRKPSILHCLVQNEPGMLSRISGTLAGRGFNIESLVVAKTEVSDLSRMTIVLYGIEGSIEQCRRQIEDLVPVWAVLDYSSQPLIKREILLAKVSLLGPEFFEEIIDHHSQIYKSAFPNNNYDSAGQLKEHTHHPRNIAPSEALRQKHEHLKSITDLAKHFGGKIADISENNCIVELCAKPERVSTFIQLLQPFGILELARTGMSALPRTLGIHEINQELVKESEDVVDASQLPPG